MATTQQLLAEAEAAYHELLIGVSAKVIVHQNGQRTEYTPANRSALKSYINELKSLLGTNAPIGPMKVWF